MSETQFATDLTVTGLRKLCTVPVGLWGSDSPVSYDQSYPLHVGLHSFTSGLERLCKLAISCHGYVTAEAFPPLRKRYGHRIGGLLDAVEALDLSQVNAVQSQPSSRPKDDLGPGLTEMLERFANGSGRYEHLDSLSDPHSAVSTLETWSNLCSGVTVSEHVKEMLAIRMASVNAIRDLCTAGEVEASTYSLIDHVDQPLFEPSIGVSLKLYRTASWVASILNLVTYYTSQELPLLGEAVQDLYPPADRFFQYTIAQVEDESIATEELREHFARALPPSDDDF